MANGWCTAAMDAVDTKAVWTTKMKTEEEALPKSRRNLTQTERRVRELAIAGIVLGFIGGGAPGILAWVDYSQWMNDKRRWPYVALVVAGLVPIVLLVSALTS